jgi:hypothetical protein
MNDIAKALQSLRPNSFWSLHDNNYETLEWFDNNSEPPSQEEIESELLKLEAEYAATQYQRQRQPEYPPLADLADALYWQSQGDESKMTAYIAAVEAVKQKYPKGVA